MPLADMATRIVGETGSLRRWSVVCCAVATLIAAGLVASGTSVLPAIAMGGVVTAVLMAILHVAHADERVPTADTPTMTPLKPVSSPPVPASLRSVTMPSIEQQIAPPVAMAAEPAAKSSEMAPAASLPAKASSAPSDSERRRRPRRPAFALVIGVAVAFTAGRGVLEARYGFVGGAAAFTVFAAVAIVWRLVSRRRARRAGVIEYTPEIVRQQVESSGVAPDAFDGDGTILRTSVLVINQLSKLVEVRTEYQVFGADGAVLGRVRQVGQGRVKEIVRVVSNVDKFFTHRFEVLDRSEDVVLQLVRPRKLFKSRIEVYDPDGRPIGRIVQENVFGKIRFGLYGPAEAHRLAVLQAENWRAWDFTLTGSEGAVIARTTKTWEGYARTYVTNADHYVVRIHQLFDEPMRSLVVAAALGVDLALKQDARGIGGLT